MKRILFEVPHPSTAYIAKYLVPELEKEGENVLCIVRERENMVKYLLDKFEIKYEELEAIKKGFFCKATKLLINDIKLLKIAKKYNPDIFVGRNSPYFSHVSFLLNKPFISLFDSDVKRSLYWLSIPFASSVITPKTFKCDLGSKHIPIDSYKELAYLHPNWYTPQKDVYDLLGIAEGEMYIIFRFGGFDAIHDVGISGFDKTTKISMVKKLSKYCKVFISSEAPLHFELKKYELKIPIERIHDAFYYSSLLITDTQTSTTEAACLGTPAIRSNKWVGSNDMSNFVELEKKYGLIYNLRKPKEVIKKAEELLQKDNLKEKWAIKRKKLLEDKIDLTSFMVWFIKEYPKSFETMKEYPEYHERFKCK